MFGARRSPDSSHQIDGGKKLRAFTNFMVLKKTPDNLMRSPEEPYYLKDMEENAKDLLSLSRGRGLQMEKERNIDKEQRFRTPSQSNVSHSIQQNSTIENFIYNHENDVSFDESQLRDDEEDSLNGENGTPNRNPATQNKVVVTPAYKEIILTEPDVIPCWREFSTKSYKSFRIEWHHYIQNGGIKSIPDLTTLMCKYGSSIFYDDLFENTNADIIRVADQHFGVDSKDEVMAKLKATAIIKHLEKPCLIAVDDYINRFLKILYSVDEGMWPSIKETKRAFIDGFAP